MEEAKLNFSCPLTQALLGCDLKEADKKSDLPNILINFENSSNLIKIDQFRAKKIVSIQ